MGFILILQGARLVSRRNTVLGTTIDEISILLYHKENESQQSSGKHFLDTFQMDFESRLP